MLNWFAGLGTLKISLIVAAATFAAGTFAGIRWQKGALYDDAEKRVEVLYEAFSEALGEVGNAWRVEAERAKIKVEEWSLQNREDEALMRELAENQVMIRRGFDDLEKTIRVTSDVGTCVFTADALRLLNAASHAANNDGITGDRPTDPAESEAGGSDD